MENTLAELAKLTDELTQRDAKLRESEKLFRTVFCINPLPMSLTTLDGTIIKINRALCEVVGRREEDLVGKKPSDFDMYVYKEQRDEIVMILKNGEKIDKMKVAYNTRNGQVDVLLSAKVVTIDETPYILAVFMYA